MYSDISNSFEFKELSYNAIPLLFFSFLMCLSVSPVSILMGISASPPGGHLRVRRRSSPLAGYLCVRVEEDEELGTTLILTWVPNSRIQRQDEAALRYVTPEGSPMRGGSRRRSGPSAPPAPEGPEGGGEGPAPGRGGAEPRGEEEGQQCSGVPVDLASLESHPGPGLDPPSCLSPVSEALAEGSGPGPRGNGGR